jgi:hypothetical protein
MAKRNPSQSLRLYSINGQEESLLAVKTVQSQQPRGIPLGRQRKDWRGIDLMKGESSSPFTCQYLVCSHLPLLEGRVWLHTPCEKISIWRGGGFKYTHNNDFRNSAPADLLEDPSSLLLQKFSVQNLNRSLKASFLTTDPTRFSPSPPSHVIILSEKSVARFQLVTITTY